MTIASKRLVNVAVDERYFMEILNLNSRAAKAATAGSTMSIAVPAFQPLPADAVVRSVAYDLYRRCFIVTIESDEFAEVPCGDFIPMLDVEFSVFVLPVST